MSAVLLVSAGIKFKRRCRSKWAVERALERLQKHVILIKENAFFFNFINRERGENINERETTRELLSQFYECPFELIKADQREKVASEKLGVL
jgi:hypothetical protein